MAEEKTEAKKKPARAPKAAAEGAAPKKAAAEKPKAAKKPAAAAPVAPSAAAKPPAPAKAPRAKPEKVLKVTQIGSPIGREDYQRATLKGLGLNKLPPLAHARRHARRARHDRARAASRAGGIGLVTGLSLPVDGP